MDQRSRAFRGSIRTFIRARDQVRRVPGCHARIRDIDHVHRHADGGATSIDNGVGMCQQHNLAKEMSGWDATLAADGTLELTTPSGKKVSSPVPGLHRMVGPALGAKNQPVDGPHTPVRIIDRPVAIDHPQVLGPPSAQDQIVAADVVDHEAAAFSDEEIEALLRDPDPPSCSDRGSSV